MYLYLLEEENKLLKKGKYLYHVNKEDYLELLKYKVKLENHKYW